MSYSAIDMLTGEGFNEQYAFNQVAYLKALERARKHLSFQNGQLVFLIKNGSDIYQKIYTSSFPKRSIYGMNN